MQRYIGMVLAAIMLISIGVRSLVYAQSSGSTTASLVGRVKDEQGAALPGSVVTARQLETNLSRTVTVNEDGSFVLLTLPPGNYEVSAELEGFTRKVLPLTLTIGTTALADFSLTVGQTSEVVVVKADSSVSYVAEKTEKSTIVNEDAITSLPINRRNFLDFALTTAGVVQDRLPLQGAQATSGLNFNGQNARQNNITIDGIDNNDLNSGSVRSTYSQEAVKEFQVISNSFSAEFGRAQGGVVNIVTRAGTNEIHGSIFFFNRNDTLSARNAFSPEKAEFDQYQFGAALGGPIKKDRAFFFSSFERLSIADSINVSIPAPIIASLNRNGFQARAGAIPFSEGNSAFLQRVDLKLTNSDQLTVRYNYAGNYNGVLEPFGGARTESVGGLQRLRDDNVSVTNTYVSSGLNLVNETRFLFARRDQIVEALDPVGPRLNIFTQEIGTVVAGRSAFLPNPRKELIYQFVNNLSLPRGKHQLKFGVDYLHVDLPRDSNSLPVGAGGQAFFSPLAFGTGLPSLTGLQAFDPNLRTPQQQAFLAVLGRILPTRFPGFPVLDLTRQSIPTTFIQGFGDSRVSLVYDYISAFAQDDIRLSSKLLMKLGVRYDQERVELVPKNRGNFSPRVAIAYRYSDRLNLHGAYGIFHGVTPFAPVLNFRLGDRNGYQVPVLVFPFSLIPVSLPGRKFPEGMKVPGGIPNIPQLRVGQLIQPDFKNGYAQHVNVGFNYLLDNQTVVSASYQFVRGLKLFLSRDINPVVRPIPGDPLGSRIRGRIIPSRGTIQELGSTGDSYYNALTLEVRRNFSTKLGLLANYTYSKALDNFVDYRVELSIFQNGLDLKGERGFSLQDVRNRFVLSGIWSLDYTKNRVLKDFVLSSIVTLESGRPYNLLTGVDLDMNADLVPGDRPNRIARNAGITPGFASVDLRLTRRFAFKERFKLETIFEAFNLFNRLNISSDVNGNVFPPKADGTFDLPKTENGRFVLPKARQNNAFPPRRFQFGFRLNF